MMLARRIIPCLDVKDGRVVKGTNFANPRDAGDPVELGARYDREGADELVLLDITASSDRRRTMIELASRVAAHVFIPFLVGGGIRTVEDIQAILRAGADKVSINTSAVEDPDLIANAAALFGSQCVVVAVDARRKSPGKWEVHTHGGRTPTGIDALRWVRQVERLGAGEILLTSMDADGTRSGYDLELCRAVADSVGIPVIASGGGGSPKHMYEALTIGRSDAVLAASLFHYDGLTTREVKEYLAGRGVPVRL